MFIDINIQISTQNSFCCICTVLYSVFLVMPNTYGFVWANLSWWLKWDTVYLISNIFFFTQISSNFFSLLVLPVFPLSRLISITVDYFIFAWWNFCDQSLSQTYDSLVTPQVGFSLILCRFRLSRKKVKRLWSISVIH